MLRNFFYRNSSRLPLHSLGFAALSTAGLLVQNQTHVKCHVDTTAPAAPGGSDCGCIHRPDEVAALARPSGDKTDADTLPVYTSAQVSQHDGVQNASVWMSYGGLVYDVTSFLPVHPGGTARIQRAAGSAIEPYWNLHSQHFRTEQPMQILDKLVVGRLATEDQQRVDDAVDALQEKMDSFRLECQTTTTATRRGRGRTVHFSLDDLQKLPKTDFDSRVGCPNKQGPVQTSLFAGVLLRDLLVEIGASKVTKVLFEAMDGETVQLDEEDIMGEDILVAYEENGAALSQRRGFPLRVIIPGRRRVVKWVKRIEVS